MGKRDPRVDDYIERAGEFAKPILRRLRQSIHRGCPEVTEGVKWNAPFFSYKGLLCMMAAFKAHCTFGFWKHRLLEDRMNQVEPGSGKRIGRFEKIPSLSDLPDEKTIVEWVKAAARLNELGLKMERKPVAKGDRVLEIPAFFTRALRTNQKALATFEGGSYTFRKEYVEWVTEAKAEETRERRLKTALQWMAEGKGRNWKYEK